MSNENWNSFANAALSVAKALGSQPEHRGLSFWDADMASEFTRMLMGRCPPERALTELRRIASEENRLASPTDIIKACRAPTQQKRWITFSREIVGKGAYSFVMEAPNDGSSPESHLGPGETLIDDSEAPRHYQRVTPVMRQEIMGFAKK